MLEVNIQLMENATVQREIIDNFEYMLSLIKELTLFFKDIDGIKEKMLE